MFSILILIAFLLYRFFVLLWFGLFGFFPINFQYSHEDRLNFTLRKTVRIFL